MKYFISSIPVFDKDMAVQAYRLITQDGKKLMGAAEDFRLDGGALQTPGLDTISQTGIEPFAGGLDIFVEIGEYQLLLGMPMNIGIEPEKFVCIVNKNTILDDKLREKLDILKENGYRLAIDELPENADMNLVSGMFSFVLLSIKSVNLAQNLKSILKYTNSIKPVITDIPDMENFKKLSTVKNVLLSGDFYIRPITKGKANISPLKVNSLNLLKQINEDDLDLIAAAKTIERDPALSISLLRFINTSNPNRSRKIESIRQAVATLGQKEVKKWATVAISVGLGEDRPSEITRLSLIRAKFAENLAPAFGLAVKSGILFMTGLFSLLDVILEMPMEKAIKEVASDKEMEDALVHNTGQLHDVLSLIYAYEHADWNNSSIILVHHDVSIEELTDAFVNSLLWYKQLLETIDAKEEDNA